MFLPSGSLALRDSPKRHPTLVFKTGKLRFIWNSVSLNKTLFNSKIVFLDTHYLLKTVEDYRVDPHMKPAPLSLLHRLLHVHLNTRRQPPRGDLSIVDMKSVGFH